MRRLKRTLGILCLAALPAMAQNPLAFSVGGLSGWQPRTFSAHAPTSYALVAEGNTNVLHAVCQNSASGLVWKHVIDLRKTPVIEWSWKISRVYPGLDPHKKAGDDYPARVYVVTGNPLFPWTLRSLVYVWANARVSAVLHGPGGTPFYPDPYTGQAEIVALRQGPAGVGAWVFEQRTCARILPALLGLGTMLSARLR